MSRLFPAVLDGILVLVFATIGRRSHAEGLSVSGVLTTAWPFLAGAAAGWVLAVLATDESPRAITFGAIVAVGAVVIGMLLRQATDQGTAPAFIAVATITLALLLLGWRLVARWVG